MKDGNRENWQLKYLGLNSHKKWSFGISELETFYDWQNASFFVHMWHFFCEIISSSAFLPRFFVGFSHLFKQVIKWNISEGAVLPTADWYFCGRPNYLFFQLSSQKASLVSLIQLHNLVVSSELCTTPLTRLPQSDSNPYPEN